MPQIYRYCVLPTIMGWVGVAGTSDGLKRITLPHLRIEDAQQEVTRDLSQAVEDTGFFGDLPQRIRRYFTGEPVTFSDALDLTSLSPFQRLVYQACKEVPRGGTISYGELARKARRPGAARAVGRAMATNPLPIVVPCHRVVGSDGDLTGFGGGLELKRRMLDMEAARPS